MKAICLFFVLLLTSISNLFGQKSSSGEEVHKLVSILQREHYSPKPIDDVFSEKLFYKFLQSIDKRHLLFLKQEVLGFAESKRMLDDELNNQQLKFISKVAPVYRADLERAKRILETLKAKEFKIVKDEKYIPNHKDTFDYAFNEAELAMRWDKYIKLEVLLKDFQNHEDSIATKLPLKDIYQKILNKEILKINTTIAENKNSLRSLYYEYARCIPAIFDAHSNYMSYNDYQNFETMLSTEDYKFGITLDKNKFGAIEIIRVTPGSPAWKSGKINIGDVITHLKWQYGEKVEVNDLELEEVIALLDFSNNLYLEFTIKSSTGVIQVFSLKKEKTNSTENTVKGYVLTGKDNRKLGYICLPSFYTLFESENMLGCANDVAKELFKLQQENIEGLIFDLRNNGGGSLKEGLELSGVFINEGTLGIYRKKGVPPVSMKDWNRGVAYGGPMVVMVNGHSASASELMASTLQDFNRAVIVGSDTYGKATGQEMFPLNPAESSVADSLKSGFASVTVLKLYRVTGKSNQVSGLHPDIVLPDPLVDLYENESKEPEALIKDTVLKKTYYQPLSPLPLEKLRTSSEVRINKNNNFTRVKELKTHYSEAFDIGEAPIVLNQEAIKIIYKQYQQWLLQLRKYYFAETSEYTVKPTAVDGTINQLSEEDRLLSEYSMKRISNDITLEESYLILNDLINYK
jgi:carboxyl-terminal processing protease